jgi:TPR repeat protein
MALSGISMRTLCLIVLAAFSLSLSGGPASAEKRIALVVGNSAYQNVTRLDNPKNDAALIATTMRDLGFMLVGNGPQLDLDKAGLDRAVQNFGRSIQGADVALFYYAGHGVQVNGSNFLVPVNANPTRENDVDFEMVDVNVVLRQMQGSRTKLNLVILDACRNNPFGVGGLRAAQGGLAQMRAPEGTLISYATQPGSVAQDGDVNSPYTRALASTVRRPGLDIFQTFNQVGLAVKRATGGEQQPWVSSSPIDGDFFFVPPPGLTASHQPDAPVQDIPKSAAASGSNDTRRSLEKSANAGDAIAMVNLGFMYEKGNGGAQDLTEARRWYERAAAAGNTTGMANMGVLYRDGIGVAKDPTEARKWFEKSAAGGDSDAMNSLGLFYQTGYGAPPDYATARKWFEKAVAAGNVFGMRNLGVFYRDGIGVAKDFTEARKWFEKAAAGGNSDAMNSLGLFYQNGYGAPPDYATARKWFEKAAAAGHSGAMVNLGFLYDRGYGVAQDETVARQWYEKAAAGNVFGMKNLGVLYRDGIGVPKDFTEARKWFEKAAAAGHSDSMVSVGYMYEMGNGVPRDLVEARKWYEKAAAAGNAVGMTNLGNLYLDGRGVTQDRTEARKWLEKAAATCYERAKIALQKLDSPEPGNASFPQGTPPPLVGTPR